MACSDIQDEYNFNRTIWDILSMSDANMNCLD